MVFTKDKEMIKKMSKIKERTFYFSTMKIKIYNIEKDLNRSMGWRKLSH